MLKAEMNRKQQQADFIYQVGLVLKPIIDLAQEPENFDRAARSHIRAQFNIDYQRLHNSLHDFCHVEREAHYLAEWHDIQHAFGRINEVVRKHSVEAPTTIAAEVPALRLELLTAILAVPVPFDSTVFDAKTPFSAYCRMRELCGTSQNQVFYCDRYLSHTLFHRFFEAIPDTTHLTILTWPREKHRNPAEFDAFIDVSRLYAKERPMSYKLLTRPDVHDRWLQCDSQIFLLGGSVKDMADATVFTITGLPATPENLDKVASLFNSATELFGPAHQTHP